jgi:VCBS repeat-containing protein
MTDTGLGTVGNSILGNTIYGNNGLSIDLNNDGVTANDTDDVDMGSNNLQNYPLLISAVSNGLNSVNLNGSINTNTNTTYRIEFFASATGDGSGNPEAERYLGFATVTSDGSGNATFSETLSVLVSDGEVITATATVDLSGGNYGDTSEFAANIVAEVNEAPVNTLPSAQTVDEDTQLNITGISVTDVDGNLAFTQLSVTNGVLNVSLLGGATISSGTNDSNSLTLSGSQVQINAALATLSYQGNLDFNGIDTLTVLSTDSGGTPLSDSDNIVIRVDAVSDAAVIAGVDSGIVTEDVDVLANIISSSGLLTINDVDTGESTFQAETINGTYGDLSIDTTGNWRYEANNTQLAIQQLDVGESLTDIFIVTAFDGTTHNVVITLNGSEDAAEIGGTTTGSVTQDATLTTSGKLTITDIDTSDNPVKFDDVTSTLGTAGYGIFELINNNWTYILDNNNSAVVSMVSGQILNDSIRFKASDGSTQLVIVTIYGSGNPADTSPEEPTEEKPIEEEPVEEEPTEEKPDEKEPETENNTSSNKSELGVVEATIQNEISTRLSSFREVETNLSQTDNISELINSNFTLSEDEVPKDINPKKYNVQMPDDISLNLDELDLWVDTETEVDEEGKNALWAEFDKTLQNMKDEMARNIPKDIEVNIVTGSAATFSVGILAWALQGGTVLASLMSTAPILSRFDPIPILQSKGKSIDIQGDLGKSTKDKPSRQVDDLFSQGNSKNE